MHEQFAQEFSGAMTPEQTQLYEQCKRYFDATEQFDLRVCRFTNSRGYGMPSSPSEMGSVNRNAIQARKRIFGDTWQHNRKEIAWMLDLIEQSHLPYYTGRNT